MARGTGRWLALCLLALALLGSPPAAVRAAPAEQDVLSRVLPDERDLGMTVDASTVPTYRRHPPDRWAFDANYGLFTRRPGSFLPGFNGGAFTFHAAANLIFTLNAFLARLAISLLIWSFHMSLVNDALGLLAATVAGLREGLLARFLWLALGIAGLWASWHGLARMRATRALSGLAGTVLALSLAFAFLYNFAPAVSGAGEVADAAARVVLGAISLPTGTPGCIPAAGSTADAALLGAADRLWAMLVRSPWAWGEFGRPEDPCSGDLARVTAAEAQAAGERLNDASLSWRISAGDGWSAHLLALSPDSPTRQVLAEVLGDPEIDHGDHPLTPATLGTEGAAMQLLLALTALPVTVMALAMGLVYAGSMFLAQVLILALTAISPAVFLIALIPETGLTVLRRWGVALLGAFGAKVVYGALWGLVLLLVDVITRVAARSAGGGLPLLLSNLLLALTFLGGILFRRLAFQTVLGAASPSALRRQAVQAVAAPVAEHRHAVATTVATVVTGSRAVGQAAGRLYDRFRGQSP